MAKGRCLGLIGGVGVGAAAHYYAELARMHREHACSLDIVMVHAETDRIFEFAQAADRTGMASYLLGFVHRLQAAGAEFVAIPAVTPHLCIHQLVERSPLPLIDIFTPLRRELRSKGIRRAAVLGTRFVFASDMFGELDGVEFIHASKDTEDSIHRTYVEIAGSGRATPEQRNTMVEIAQSLCRDGAETVLLAGTDLVAAFPQKPSEFPSTDCAELHLAEIAQQLMS
jgi:aspartate racemase